MNDRPSSPHSPTPPPDIPYRLPWRSVGLRVGAHRGKLAGSGGLFRDLASLLHSPDPRRIDLRASARDPFENLHVRRFEQKAAISVYALVDVSASMGFRGNTDKIRVAADLCAALASSARSAGDAFGLIACDSAVRADLYFPATRTRCGEVEMVQRLREFSPTGKGADGLAEAAALIAGRRKLVFLLSDFHMPRADIETIFAALSSHDIVPIILLDSLEVDQLPRWGILSLIDQEVGRRRLVVMRPYLRGVWQRRSEARRAELKSIAARYGREPFEVHDRVDWDALTAYLIDGRS